MSEEKVCEEKDVKLPTETNKFTVTLMGGTILSVEVQSNGSVRDLRDGVEKDFTVPPACFLKLLQDGQVLLDDISIKRLDSAQPVFGVISRETSLEVLLQAASSYRGYHEIVSEGLANAIDGNDVCCKPMPTILQVLEDMSGEMPKLEKLRKGKDEGSLEFSGEDGQLLLPSIDALALLKSSGSESFKCITISVDVNSDAYNRGLGVVLEASPLLDNSLDEHGLPNYIYNGFGISDDKKQNAVKFHPGMSGGQLRIEGPGGWGNCSVGFTPLKWTDAGGKFHKLELTLGADGHNEVCIIGSEPDQVWRKPWTHQLTDGRYFPALYAWLDLGSTSNPLYIKDISFKIKMR